MSPRENYQVIIAWFLCTKTHIDNIFSMFIWPVSMYQLSHGIFMKSSRFNEHVGLEKLFCHVLIKIQLLNMVGHCKSSWGVCPIWFSSKSRSLTLQWTNETRKLCKWEESLALCPCSVEHQTLNLALDPVSSWPQNIMCPFSWKNSQ